MPEENKWPESVSETPEATDMTEGTEEAVADSILAPEAPVAVDVIPSGLDPVSVPEEPLPEEAPVRPAEDPLFRQTIREESNSSPAKKKGKASAISPIVEFAEIIVGALVAAILVLTLICRTGVVSGTSMVPTMYHGDRYIISDLFYTPEQGDIVVFRPEIEGEDELWIKRVIAVEGQKVYIDPNTYRVYVDDQLLEEPYLSSTGTIPHSTPNPIVVPEGHVYVMGDNRGISHDSRYADLGCVSVGQLAGRVILRFWPLEDFGTCK